MSQPQPLSVNSIQTRSASEGFRPSIETRSAHEGFRPATETRSASEGFPGGMLAMKRTENDSEESLARASGLCSSLYTAAFTGDVALCDQRSGLGRPCATKIS